MKLKVVYVDDEEMLLDLFRAMFSEDYEVLTYKSSLQALHEIEGTDIDVLFSDLSMPELNGYDLLHQVAARSPQTVRVMLTGYGDTTDMLSGVQSGLVHSLIAKPWTEGQIKEVLERAVIKLKRSQTKETVRAA